MLVGLVLSTITATVLAPQVVTSQQFFRARPEDMEVREGDTVVFQCHVGNRAGAVQWSKDGFLLGFDAEVPGYPRYTMLIHEEQGIYNLKIETVKLQDEGEYQCQVGPSSFQTPIRAAARLILLIPPEVLSINDLPSGRDVEVKQGSKLVLNCKALGSKPPAVLKWYRNDVELLETPVQNSVSDGWKYTTTSTLILHPTVFDNRAKYSCVAQHKALEKEWRTHIVLSVLHPPGPPVIEGYTEGDVITAGETLTMGCISRGGNPPPQVIWYRKNVQIDPTYSLAGHVTTNTLTVIIEATDNRGVYRCEAQNSMLKDPLVASVRLSVNCQPGLNPIGNVVSGHCQYLVKGKRDVVHQYGDFPITVPPSRVKIVGPVQARWGETVTLQCTTDVSNPTTQLSWIVDGSRIPAEEERSTSVPDGWISASNLTITLTRQEPDHKSFSCVAESPSVQRKVSETHVLRVIYPPNPPTIIGYEEGSPLRVGDLQRFNCVALGGNPPATLRWFKGDREISTPVISTRSGVSSELVIRVDSDDNGAIYRCEANNTASWNPQVAFIKTSVYFPPSNLTITINPCEPRAGENVILLCMTGSSNPLSRITWRKNGQFIRDHLEDTFSSTNGGIATRSRLSFMVTSSDDRAQFVCQAKNDQISVFIRKNATIRVRHKPEFLHPHVLFNITEGGEGSVNMTARAFPDVDQYTWTKEGVTISPISKEQQQVTSAGNVLNLRNVSRLDAGLYTCHAENQEGISNATVMVNVLYGARVTNVTSQVVVNEGDNASFECWVDANPLAEGMITWKLRSSVTREAQLSPDFNRSMLTLFNVSKHDAGPVCCQVFNGIGEPAVSAGRLAVMYRPFILRHLMAKKEGADTGEDKVIRCVADGSGNVTFYWSFNGSYIGCDPETMKYTTNITRSSETLWIGFITVRNVTHKDFGRYTCEVRNHLGMDCLVLLLLKKSVPDIPGGLKAINITRNSVLLSWTPTYDGGHRQQFTVRYKKSGSAQYTTIVIPANTTLYNMKDLDPSTEYLFSINAKNLLGESAYAHNEIKVLTKAAQPQSTAKTEVAQKEPGSKKGSSKVWWIPACIVGCILIAVNLFFIIFCVRRRSNRTTPEGAGSDGQHDIMHVPLEGKLLIRPDMKPLFLANREEIKMQEFQMDRLKLNIEERRTNEYGRTRIPHCQKLLLEEATSKKETEQQTSSVPKVYARVEQEEKWKRLCLPESKDVSDLSTTPRSTTPESPRYSSTPTVSSDSPSSVYHENSSIQLREEHWTSSGNPIPTLDIDSSQSRPVLLINISNT